MMYKILFYNFLICFICASDFTFNDIPIQVDGRIKPVDSYARNQLLNVYGKRSIDISAVDWLIELLMNKSNSLERNIFKIHNSEVVHALRLTPNKKHIYNYHDISNALKSNESLINGILSKSEDKYTLVERQIVNLYLNHLRIFDLMKSLSCIIPMATINSDELSHLMNINIGENITYFDFISSISNLRPSIQSIMDKSESMYLDNSILFHINKKLDYLNISNNQIINYPELSELLNNNDMIKIEKWIPTATNQDQTDTAQLDRIYKVMMHPKSFLELNTLKSKLESLDIILYAELQNNNKVWTNSELILSNLLHKMASAESASKKRIFTNFNIIPPVSGSNNNVWISPWDLLHQPNPNKNQITLLNYLNHYIKSSLLGSKENMVQALNNYSNYLYSGKFITPNKKTIAREVWYNKSNLFYLSTILYILSLITAGLSLIFYRNTILNFSFGLLLSGWILHGLGLYTRMAIMARPPVSTLYESVLFVGFIAVFSSLIIEYFKKDGFGVLIGSILGATLHFISFGYAADGETMGTLVAVLNSNFWLATHVTIVTIGYGISLTAGLMGHIYLVYNAIWPNNKKQLKKIYNNTSGVILVALFFMCFGTILGGIWADQSWGRFWGWDPKENGALLICMWQILVLHMRIAGMIKGLEFALMMIINNIVVILAWFGVNLLSVGLHSYGFASGIATNLIIFISLELVFGLSLYYYLKK